MCACGAFYLFVFVQYNKMFDFNSFWIRVNFVGRSVGRLGIIWRLMLFSTHSYVSILRARTHDVYFDAPDANITSKQKKKKISTNLLLADSYVNPFTRLNTLHLNMFQCALCLVELLLLLLFAYLFLLIAHSKSGCSRKSEEDSDKSKWIVFSL